MLTISSLCIDVTFYCDSHKIEYTMYNIITQDFVYPNNVAYPFGGEGQPQYILLELHYDNPQMISGMKALRSKLCMYCAIVLCAQWRSLP